MFNYVVYSFPTSSSMQTDPRNDAPPDPRGWIWTGAGFERTGGVPVTDRGFRYGMSVFESFPVRGGVGILLERHLAKLREACAVTGLAAPGGALEGCADVLRGAGDGFGRIYVTAGDGPVTGECDGCRVLVLVEEREATPGRVYHRGYDLGLHAGGHVPLFDGVKTGNYWGNLRAFREGVAGRCNETLLFTPAGHLISACMANVFMVTEGRVLTPGLGTGARAGVVREWVMGRVEVDEALLTRADVAGAAELFLTSSWLGIMPGASVEGRTLGERKVAGRLMEEYRKDVEGR
jgi:branched-subunit amino acid aminotransferase/4-amino-4-deoxychorismate lyase